jgi:Rha family phage regulatory protein
MGDLVALLPNMELNEKSLANSVGVANAVGKRHANVLRDIRRLLPKIKDKLGATSDLEAGFSKTTYLGRNGQLLPAYDLTLDAFSRLVRRWHDPLSSEFCRKWVDAVFAVEDREFQKEWIMMVRAWGELSKKEQDEQDDSIALFCAKAKAMVDDLNNLVRTRFAKAFIRPAHRAHP